MYFNRIFLFSIILISFVSEIIGIEAEEDDSEIVDKLLEGYKKHIRPDSKGDPINVTVTAFILDFYNVDEKNHEFTLNLYLRQKWRDPRLEFNSSLIGDSELVLDTDQGMKIWVPDIFIVNERKSRVHDLTVKNEFTKVSSNGEIHRSSRFTVTSSCKMRLGWFPFDRHTCPIVIESYGHTADDFVLFWRRDDEGSIQNAVKVSGEVSSLTFEVKAIKTVEILTSFSNKTYSRLSLEFFIIRASTKYIQDIYLPAIAISILAFITLWCGGTHEFRLQLSSLCMISMIIFILLAASTIPKVSYQTALDFYLFNCVVMILNVVLVNFGLFHFEKFQRTAGVRMRYVQQGSSVEDVKETLYDGEAQSDFMPDNRPPFMSKFKTCLYMGCKKSKTTIPLFFLFFNLFYWIIVLIGSSGFPNDFLLLESHN